jgi:excisionase family DNA binding protein
VPGRDSPALLSIQDAAAYLSIGVTSFRESVAHELVPVRIGRRVLYSRRDLDAWITRRQEHARSPFVASAGVELSPRARAILASLGPAARP